MRVTVFAAALSLTVVSFSAATDVEAAIREPTSIPAQGLGPALQALAKDRDLQLLYRSELVRNLATAGATGDLTIDEALQQLLSGTGLTYRYLDDNTITVLPLSLEAGAVTVPSAPGSTTHGPSATHAFNGLEVAGAGTAKKSWLERFRLAQGDSSSQGSDQVGQKENLPPSSDKNAESRPIGEVIVTATKRAERVQDVPISIAVISNQDIELRGLIGMEDYLRSIPGVNEIDRGGVDNAIVIRGITVSPSNEAFHSAPTVASYFDETPISGAIGPAGASTVDVRPVDIERIEVLRGPQGTAYGSSSLGGTLRIIPVQPKLDGFGAKVGAAYSDTSGHGSDNSMIHAVFNVPIVADKLAVRAVGYRYDDSGIYRNIAGIDPATLASAQSNNLGAHLGSHVEDDVGRMVTIGGRITALWQPTDRLSLSMKFLTQQIEQDGVPEATAGTYEQIRYPIAPQARVRGEDGEIADQELQLSNAVLNYDFGWAALTSSASWLDGEGVTAIDFWTAPFPAAISLVNRNHFKSFITETRLASKLTGRFQFLGGVFYEDVKESQLQIGSLMASGAPNPFGTDPTNVASTRRERDQLAGFGEVSYDLTEKLTATVGGRYFNYGKSDVTLREGGVYRVPFGTGIPQLAEGDQNSTSFKGNLSYKPTPDSLLYASWSEGFRLGRPTSGLPASCDADNDGVVDGTNISMESTRTVESDNLENYEIGGKFTFFDGRLAIETSVYHIEWNGLPISVIAPVCNLGYTANAGAATSDGVEFQASVFAGGGLRFDFGAGYTDATLAEDAPSLRAQEGARLPGSPKISVNLASQYDFRIAGRNAFVRADSFYAGKFHGDLLESPLTQAGDYIKVDARAGVLFDRLSVDVFVRNLTNEDEFTWRGLSNVKTFFGYRLRPRTIGLQLGYSFE